ncbi:hypothetical protein [Pontiella sulfatireligans]|uniref:Uncharacterized protein n=1 Tax=Pontiella sulfatireligans TaxID=2750658 RepID=A0A6C2UMV0_9BACT|nr:hypothetical protein [Pontiella sulfatireligans]VGO20601.1 hypothetical protein SCARR_02666 [Pontiella sulfatireligans]
MKKKRVMRVIIISLSILAVSAGLFFFHMTYGYWWDRPSISDDDITEIIIHEGNFIPPGVSPVINLSGKSDEAHRVIRSINGGWHYPQLLKFGGNYSLTIYHSDSREEYVVIGSQHISVRSGERYKKYRILRDITQTIAEIRKNNPNRPSEVVLPLSDS